MNDRIFGITRMKLDANCGVCVEMKQLKGPVTEIDGGFGDSDKAY